MRDETPPGPAGATDGEGHPRGSGEVRSPLQARAPFLKNWGWESVIRINRGACERGGAQHGINSETGKACKTKWEARQGLELTLEETFSFLRELHRGHPFLFFNVNTFSSIGRELTLALFSDLPAVRKRELSSAVGHYIAGVLDRESMVAIVESLFQAAQFSVGDRVKTFRGSLRGKVTRLLPDGRVAWTPDDRSTELLSLPEKTTQSCRTFRHFSPAPSTPHKFSPIMASLSLT